MTDPLLWILVFVQVAMGGFDTIVHHETTERLAWRPSQERELRLHGVRNLAYAVLFMTLGHLEVHGLWALVVIVLLAAELLITLWDFVEEDLTRKLPASERINHTLLTLNYGAILVLLVPVLFAWSGEETALVPAGYGIATIMATLSAIAVAIFGARDLMAARRSPRLVPSAAAPLVAALAGRKRRVLITGATGFIGSRLVQALVEGGHHVTVQTRDPVRAASLATPLGVVTRLDHIDRDAVFDIIVNLAGEPIATGLWTRRKRFRIIDSRLKATADVIRLVRRLRHRPELLISGSAVGWYGLHGDGILDETGAASGGFCHRVCAAWEDCASQARSLGVRVVPIRIGIVLGIEGGMLANMLTPFEFGLGTILGDGRQWMSWISRDDLVRLIAHIAVKPDLDGPVNATVPEPVRNADFAFALGRALGRPVLFAVPARLLRAVAGDLARELLLGGQRAVPANAVESGFRFHDPDLEQVLRQMTGGRTVRPAFPALPPPEGAGHGAARDPA